MSEVVDTATATAAMATEEEERWARLPAYPHIQISSFGRVYSDITKSMMKTWINETGYHTCHVRMRVDGSDELKSTTVMVHQLVAECFLGPPPTPDHTTVDHYPDRNRAHNYASNLRWATLAMQCANRVRVPTARQAVLQTDLKTGQVVAEFATTRAAALSLETGIHQGIANCLRGRARSYKGFGWRYKVPRDDVLPETTERRPIPAWITDGVDTHAVITRDGRVCTAQLRIRAGNCRMIYSFQKPDKTTIQRHASHLALAAWRPDMFNADVYEGIKSNELALWHCDLNHDNIAVDNFEIISKSELMKRVFSATKKQKLADGESHPHDNNNDDGGDDDETNHSDKVEVEQDDVEEEETVAKKPRVEAVATRQSTLDQFFAYVKNK